MAGPTEPARPVAETVTPGRLERFFRELREQRRSGTLRLQDDPRAEPRLLWFREGVLERVRSPNPGTRLGEILLRLGKITGAHLRRAVAQQLASPQTKLGQVLRDAGFSTDEDIRDALRVQATEEVLGLLDAPNALGRFEPAAEPPAELAAEGDEAAVVALDPASLAGQSEERRARSWSESSQLLPSTRDVYVWTAGRQNEAAHRGNVVAQIGRHIDGRRDVAEIIAACGLPADEVMRGLHALVRRGVVRPMRPAELLVLADEHALQGDHGRSLLCARRAEELGGSRLGIVERIAMAHVAMGEMDRAVSRFVEHAQGKSKTGEHAEALASLELALSLSPDVFELTDLVLGELVELGRADEAVELVRSRAAELVARGDRDGAIAVLRAAVKLMPRCGRVRRQLAELHLSRAENNLAVGELDDLAKRQLREDDPVAAIGTLRRRLQLQPAAEPQGRLARTLIAAGRPADAVAALLDLVALIEREEPDEPRVPKEASDGLRAPDQASGCDVRIARALEQVLALEPTRDAVRERLARVYAVRGQAASALRHLERLWRRQEQAADDAGLLRTLPAMREHAPERRDVLEALARVLARADRPGEAAGVLREGAEQALARSEASVAAELLAASLAHTPLDLDARRRLAAAHESAGDRAAAVDQWARVGRVEAAVGRALAAACAFRTALDLEPDRADLRIELARALDEAGASEEAAREYVRAAKFCAYDEHDIGTAKRALRRAHEISPRHQAAHEGLIALERVGPEPIDLSDALPPPTVEEAPPDEVGLGKPTLGIVEDGRARPLVTPRVDAGRRIEGIIDRLRGMGR